MAWPLLSPCAAANSRHRSSTAARSTNPYRNGVDEALESSGRIGQATFNWSCSGHRTHCTRPTDDPVVLGRIADGIRLRAVRMVARHGFGYLGQALSSAELFATLYGSTVRYGIDRIVVSPGHYVIAAFAAAVEMQYADDP